LMEGEVPEHAYEEKRYVRAHSTLAQTCPRSIGRGILVAGVWG
jgi:hypothetical protein